MPKRGLIEVIKSVRYAPTVANWTEIAARAYAGTEVTNIRLRNGVVIDGAPGALIMHLYKEIWYRDEYGLRAAPLPAGATVIDIGANVGMFAVFAAVEAGAARVLAYEPFPESFALLCRNAEQNRLSVIAPHSCAVAGRGGTRTLYLSDRHGTHSLFENGRDGVQVECVTLADIFGQERVERCHFLKLDCEGAEYEILFETPADVLERIDRMALEYHDAKAGRDHGELRAWLERHGFVVTSRDHIPSRSGYLFAQRRLASG